MLPSSGFFKSVACPFFKSGLCERPHCHFKHAKADPAVTHLPSSWAPVDTQAATLEQEGKPDLFSVLNSTECLDKTTFKPAVPHTYIPTPVEKCGIGKPQGILKPPAIKQEKLPPLIPEYKPTPIIRLNNSSWDEPKTVDSVAPRKRKRHEEYDPAEVRCLSKRKVTFSLPEDDDDDVTAIDDEPAGGAVAESEEEEEDDLADIDAKFSDDDEEEEGEGDESTVSRPKPRISELSSAAVKKEADQNQEPKISEYSIVDKILVDVSRNEEFIKNFNKPHKFMSSIAKEEVKENSLQKTSKIGGDGSTASKKNKLNESGKEKAKTDALGKGVNDKARKDAAKSTNNDVTDEDSKKSRTEIKLSTQEKSDKSKKSKSAESSQNKDMKKEAKSLRKEESKPKSKDKVSSKEGADKLPKETSKQSSKEHVKSSDKDIKKSASKSSDKSVKADKMKNLTGDNSKKPSKSSSSHSSLKPKSESKKVSQDLSGSGASSGTGSAKDVPGKASKKHSSHSSKETKDSKLKDKKHDSSSSSSSLKVKKVGESHSKERKSGSHSEQSSTKSLKTSHSVHSQEGLKVTKKIQDGKISSSGIAIKSHKESGSHSSDSVKSTSKSSNTKSGDVNGSNASLEDQNIRSHCIISEISVDRKMISRKPTEVVELEASGESEEEEEDDDDNDDRNDDAVPDPEEIAVSSGSELDSDTYEECWRIFNESSCQGRGGTKNSTADDEKAEELVTMKKNRISDIPDFRMVPRKDKNHDDLAAPTKKRVAHAAEFKRPTKSGSATESKKILSPAQVMHNRYLQLKEMYDKQNEKKEAQSFLSALSKSPEGSKKWITIPPGDNPLVAAVKNKASMLSAGGSSTDGEVYPQKTVKRVAHMPKQLTKPRPIIPTEYGSKVPSNIRQRYLNTFIDECMKFCLSEEQAYEMALEEEKKAYDRSTNKTIYLNVAAITVNRLRQRALEGPPAEPPEDISMSDSSENQPSAPVVSSTTNSTHAKEKHSKKTVSHETVLAGPRAQKTSYSIERKKNKAPQDTLLRGSALYNALLEYVLTEEQLIENGFPVAHETEHGRAVFAGMYASRQIISNDRYKRVCSRCKKTYYVDDDGDYVKQEECDFHWGRIYKRKIAGSIERRYNCCQGDAESEGCCVGPGHVFDGSDNHITRGFVKTLPKTPPPDKYYGVYALDCEMCYTTAGTELTRVTVINPDLKPVFETFVKPEHKVLDYNTRFSGITEENLVGVTTSIRDVQAILLCMFNDKTILIGHSLESDFKALKLIHKTVVDTSVVFPHKLGPPYKRALRTLMAEKCNKIIQNDTEGHDSQEDAAACMELMLVKLREDMKYSSR